MTESLAHSWNRLMRWRSECFKRFGAILNFPIETPDELVGELLAPGIRILDIGAGAHKPFEKTIRRVTSYYYCLDTDPDGIFDFRSFAEIPEDLEFDLAIANQVLEHLSVPDALNMVSATFSKLTTTGKFIATVPNTAHPVRQRDISHITPWVANDLYSLFKYAGFEIDAMSRYNKFPLTRDPLKRWVVETVCEEFRIDWCDSVMICGTKLG
ncbi:MAG: class I SAM-dependent methyltransferase [Desulfomonilaceae bacterium]